VVAILTSGDQYMIEIGRRLREERTRLELSQGDFARVGGVLSDAQGKYERGQRSPSALYLASLIEIGVDVLYVLTGDRHPQMPNKDQQKVLEDIPLTVRFPNSDREILADLLDSIAQRT
jgi:transcriptional regulator with XRE-family HTH domain